MTPLLLTLLVATGAGPGAVVPADPAAAKSATPGARGGTVAGFRYKAERLSAGEREQLDRFLADLVGNPLDATVVDEAQARLDAVRRYRRARCAEAGDGIVQCTLWRARVLREVKIEGLPRALLESDVRKRIFLKPGEPLDEEEAGGRSRLVRQRQRIEEYLDREGFMGARVRLLVRRAKEPGEYNVTVRVRGGAFVDVHRVDLRRWEPLSQRQLQEAFGHMCLTSEGALDGFFMGLRTACFNKRRLQATIEHFTDVLHARGYPEARIRVTPQFVDPAHADVAKCALSGKDLQSYKNHGLKPPPQCVNLVVDVEAGTQVTVRFHVQPGEKPIAETPVLFESSVLWLRETFAEPFSRLFQIIADAPPNRALDTDLVEGRLFQTLTFQQAGAIDETEIGVTAQNVEKYLAQRGRIRPKVDVDDRSYPGERVVDYTVERSPIAAVRSVRFVGNHAISTKDIEKHTTLAAHVRSFGNSGAVSAPQLADDEERIRAFYEDRGYPEAEVEATAALDDGGHIDVTFVIDEGETFLLSGVVLAGGAPALTPAVLQAIRHCDGGVATKEGRPPTTPEDCKGAPLRPEELEGDAQRVQQVYASHGFPNVEASLETAFGADGTRVRITVLPPNATAEQRAHPRTNNVRQVLLGEVFVSGNFVTQRGVLLREAGLDGKVGEPLDPIALGKGISRLRRSGLYDSVQLRYLGLDGSFGNNRAAVSLTVAERPAFTVDTSIGFSTEQLLSLRTEVRHKNLFGTMLDADWSLDFGLFVGRLSQTKGQVRWPRIFGSDISASFIPLALTYFDTPAGARLTIPSTTAGQKATAAWEAPDLRRRLFSVGGSLSLDWRLQNIAPVVDDKLTLGVTVELRYDWLDLAASPIPPFSQEALQTIDGLLTSVQVDPTRVATLTPRISYNDVDNPFDPKRGFGVDAFVRASTPPFVEHGPYAVFGFAGRAYLSFFDRVTFAAGVRARVGASVAVKCPGTNLGCEWALMQNDLLLLGGERSVRGVRENEIGVFGPVYDTRLKPVLDDAGQQSFQVRPGLYGGNANLEVRTTLVKQLFLGDLQGALFADAGGSTDDFDVTAPAASVQDPRYAWSLGAGLRLVTPVGPLAFDYAFSPPRGTSQYYITLGYLF